MKVTSIIGTICMILLLWGVGCSKEEQPVQPIKRNKVVKPIKRPPIKKVKISSAPKKVIVNPQQKKIKKVKGQPEKIQVAKAKPKEKVVGEVKTAALKEPAPKPVVEKEEPTKKEEIGYYTVKKSDSLSSIAGREDVYGDPLKWPILYRQNMDKLGGMKIAEDLPDRVLHEGMRLKIITPRKLRKIQKKRADHLWVVNILSVVDEREIVPQVVTLIREGYPVYFTRVKVNGKDWMRLRLGFYKSREEADSEGKKIMALLKLTDSWSVKVGEKEFADFCGY